MPTFGACLAQAAFVAGNSTAQPASGIALVFRVSLGDSVRVNGKLIGRNTAPGLGDYSSTSIRKIRFPRPTMDGLGRKLLSYHHLIPAELISLTIPVDIPPVDSLARIYSARGSRK